MKAKILGLLAVGLLAGPMATKATVITYDFTTTLGNGSFSYDDSNTTTLPAAPGFGAGGAWYGALSFVFGGLSVLDPVVGVYDNFSGGSDCLIVVAASGANPVLSLCGPSSLWSGTQVSNLNGRGTADFQNNSIVDANHVGGGRLLSLVQPTTAVPEPGTLALLGLGLAGLGLSRRRKAD